MKKPWNITDLPVYSLVATGANSYNMNICTYVVPISRKPKIYAFAIEHGSKTLNNLTSHGNNAILQLMGVEDINLVTKLGKQSGHKVDKLQFLQNKNMVTTWNGFPVLKNAAAYLCIEIIARYPHGDHDLFIGQEVKHKVLHTQILTESHLRTAKIIST
jgi:flavin reductase (DIM6/NTAB) family NADH-FMN oxidoreductase RutF